MKNFPILKTERLLLRQLSFSDSEALYSLASSREIAEGTYIPHPYDKEMAEEFIFHQAKDFENGQMTNFGIFLQNDDILIGSIGLTFDDKIDEAELGYWIGVPYWGNGYCTEAAKEVVRYGFIVLKLNMIYAFHFSGNDASGKVLKKVGMNYQGTRHQEFEHMGKLKDIEIYNLVNKDYFEGTHGQNN